MGKKFFIYVFSVLLVLLTSSRTFSQEKISYSFRIENEKFASIIDAIELKTGYRFFYDTMQADTAKQTFVVSNLSMESLLSELLKNTRFRFYILDRKEVFIVDKTSVIESYYFVNGIHRRYCY